MGAGVLGSIAVDVPVVVTGVVLYLIPGLLLLRRVQIANVERVVISIALSAALSMGLLTVLGLVFGLSPTVLGLGALIMIIGAVRWPLPHGALASSSPRWTVCIPPMVLFVVTAIQAERPALFTTFDALALWAPLADGIARSGELTPNWVPTILRGFPPGVALLAGTISVPSGSLNEGWALLIPPLFGALTVLVAMLLAGRSGLVGARSMTVAVLLASPLIARAVTFHDDWIVAFFVAVAAYVGLSARGRAGWLAAGIAAGGAFAVKPLGGVAFVLIAAILWAQKWDRRSALAAGCGMAVGLPWYLGNFVRFGDPLFPFLSTSTDSKLRMIVEDHASYLAGRHPDQIELAGWLAVGLMAVGLAVGLAYVLYRSWRIGLSLLLLLVAFIAVWRASNYGTRHLIVLYPVYAAVAGVGLAIIPRVIRRRRAQATRFAVTLVWSFILAVSIWNVARESQGLPPFGERTGLYSLALGKWYGLSLSDALSPPPDDQVFGEISELWTPLRQADRHARVLSFDTRSWYIPQNVLSAGEDVEAVEIYLAGDADAQHAAMRTAGVRYVLTRNDVDSYHRVFYELGPWGDLDLRPDLYRLVVANRLGSLYELRFDG